MAIFKIKKTDYSTLWDITNVLGYITRSSATFPYFISTHGMYTSTPEGMAKQLLATKTFCGQTSGRQIYHIILSFKNLEMCKYDEICDTVLYLMNLPDLYGHQSIGAVHTDKETPDAHIIFNSVNTFTGKKADLTSLGFWRKQLDFLSDYMLDVYGYSIYFRIIYD